MTTMSPDILHRVLSAFNDAKTPHVGTVTIGPKGVHISCASAGFEATIDGVVVADGATTTIMLSKLYGVASNARSVASGPLTLSIDDAGCLVVASDMVRARIPPQSDAASCEAAEQSSISAAGVEVNMKWLATAIKKTAAADNGIVRIGVNAKELFIGESVSFVRPAIGQVPAEHVFSMDMLKTIVRSACCGVTGVIKVTSGIQLHIDNSPIHVNIRATHQATHK
jgi:hypothetical protein